MVTKAIAPRLHEVHEVLSGKLTAICSELYNRHSGDDNEFLIRFSIIILLISIKKNYGEYLPALLNEIFRCLIQFESSPKKLNKEQ